MTETSEETQSWIKKNCGMQDQICIPLFKGRETCMSFISIKGI